MATSGFPIDFAGLIIKARRLSQEENLSVLVGHRQYREAARQLEQAASYLILAAHLINKFADEKEKQ